MEREDRVRHQSLHIHHIGDLLKLGFEIAAAVVVLAIITVAFVPRDWPALKTWIFWPAIVCGQHSLETFCLGVFLSFAGHFVFTEVSNRVLTQIVVSFAGIAIMVAVAALISWYRQAERRGGGPRPPAAAHGRSVFHPS
jgi:high-affinity nickel permease